MISPYLDAFRVDIKAFYENSFKKITGVKKYWFYFRKNYRSKENWYACWSCYKCYSNCNDSRKEMDDLSKWIFENLGSKTPWHVTRFIHTNNFLHRTTPIKTLEIIREIGEKMDWNLSILEMFSDILMKIPFVQIVKV